MKEQLSAKLKEWQATLTQRCQDNPRLLLLTHKQLLCLMNSATEAATTGSQDVHVTIRPYVVTCFPDVLTAQITDKLLTDTFWFTVQKHKGSSRLALVYHLLTNIQKALGVDTPSDEQHGVVDVTVVKAFQFDESQVLRLLYELFGNKEEMGRYDSLICIGCGRS